MIIDVNEESKERKGKSEMKKKRQNKTEEKKRKSM